LVASNLCSYYRDELNGHKNKILFHLKSLTKK